MAILNNIGHDDHQRFTPERDNIPHLARAFLTWADSGKPIDIFKENEAKDENLGCPFQTFVVRSDALNHKRLDAFYYAPDLRRTWRKLRNREAKVLVRLIKGSDLKLLEPVNKIEEDKFKGKVFKYFEIGDVTRGGAITNYREDLFENLPTRGRLRVRSNDVIFAKNNSSRGTAVIIPPEFDGHLVTTGFIGIRPKGFEEALLLWSIFESETFRKQIYYLSVTAVQPEVREDIFKREFLLPIPTGKRNRNRLIERARRVHKLHELSRRALEATLSEAGVLFEGV